MEWNVENLFDTLRTTGKDDRSFTPEGDHRWNTARYRSKLTKISRTIAAAGGQAPVDLVALIEVENDSVLYDLTRRTKLWRLGYEYLTTDSPDERGINVGLLYQPSRFLPLSVDTIRVLPPSRRLRPSRDILHVGGRITTGDTLDLFVVHLPSRRNGKPAANYRRAICRRLKSFTDSLQAVRRRPSIVLTGDFNAFYPETCFSEDLCALPIPPNGAKINDKAFYMLSEGLRGRDGILGTYKYQGCWNRLDHFLVNGRAVLPVALRMPEKEIGIYTTPANCRIGDFPWLLERATTTNETQPFRTFLGTFYHGGYSDHLPLLLDLFF